MYYSDQAVQQLEQTFDNALAPNFDNLEANMLVQNQALIAQVEVVSKSLHNSDSTQTIYKQQEIEFASINSKLETSNTNTGKLALDSTLQATNGKLDTANSTLHDILTALQNAHFVTEDKLDSELENYPTNSALSAALALYPTIIVMNNAIAAALASALVPYSTTAQCDAKYLSKDVFNAYESQQEVTINNILARLQVVETTAATLVNEYNSLSEVVSSHTTQISSILGQILDCVIIGQTYNYNGAQTVPVATEIQGNQTFTRIGSGSSVVERRQRSFLDPLNELLR